jgi:hypothetical protein
MVYLIFVIELIAFAPAIDAPPDMALPAPVPDVVPLDVLLVLVLELVVATVCAVVVVDLFVALFDSPFAGCVVDVLVTVAEAVP